MSKSSYLVNGNYILTNISENFSNTSQPPVVPTNNTSSAIITNQKSPSYLVKWTGVASSNTGNYLFACAYSSGIYISKDYGTSWNLTSAPIITWLGISCNSTGERIVAVTLFNYIYISNDYGITWIRTSAPYGAWRAVTSNNTGQYITAVSSNDEGSIYVSNDYGVTWSTTNSPTNDYWSNIKSNFRISN